MYNSEVGSISNEACVFCPAGSYCLQGAHEPWPCWPGTFQEQQGQTKCSDCPAGTECWAPGMIAATPCPAGTYELNDQCMVTPPGTYSSASSTQPKVCQAGFFSYAGAAECEECPVGTFCEQESTTPILCPPGFFNDKAGAMSF